MYEYVLKAGQTVKVHGVPVTLTNDTKIQSETDLVAAKCLEYLDGDGRYLVAESPGTSYGEGAGFEVTHD